ncbi:unnamed protein product [[Candida] boidinii]|uniref:Unnamed protein product n=1 Tax=Candida boidinii TaxID=5477 RepID=A0A9W6SXD5_CANBO|nr:hypothetical protein BVG19_g5153 [[Candida] boidinii]OWB53691.1 hypothetical protein B5S27_g5298 [[Candida] boidinii]OWB69622.1 hypothetical protein B5S30_g5043 [[Candida] boidinii]OWB81422.1 hypothetical protein B5S33_g39 [[Candida] boidinii]GME69242.1 unnamed protein product [[Candida] boidinii]
MESLASVRKAYEFEDPLAGLKIPFVDEYLKPYTYGNVSDYIHHIVFAALLYQSLFQVSYLFTYPLKGYISQFKNDKIRLDFSIRIVSFLQSILIVGLSIPCFQNDILNEDHVFAQTPYGSMLCAFATGYFVWDMIISLFYVQLFGIGFFVHGFVSTIVFLIGTSGYIQYYAPIFLLFEISTPFLDIRWVGLKFPGLISDTAQLVNNIILILTFFVVRICWGWFQVFRLACDFYVARNDPRFNVLFSTIILSCNFILDLLNFYWFYKMMVVAVNTLKKMFSSAEVDDSKLKLM